ncbi:MAG: hypothetical protein JO041_07980 [Acidobacteria bacterium]|nr:hypothetical protein [Acidobacteriota bacterium]
MKDLYEVLRLKEQEYKRISREIEALRIAASLLSEDRELAPSEVGVSLSQNAGSPPPRSIERPVERPVERVVERAVLEEPVSRWP